MSKRIRVDLGALRPLPCVELDPTKKYLFIVDPCKIDIKQFMNLDLGIDAHILCSMGPSEQSDLEERE